MVRVYDLHAHCAVAGVADLVAGQPGLAAEQAEQAATMGDESIAYNRQVGPGWFETMADLDARIETMDRQGVDVQVVTSSPGDYHYWADEALAASIVEAVNTGIAGLIDQRPDRLQGLGMVALQHPELAAEQLGRAMTDLGLRGAMISTSVGATDLSHRRLEPFWAAAEELGATIFIHPWGCTLGSRLARSYLFNIVGNPTETALALSHLIFSGVLDRYPGLRICAAHGGGYLPAYRGRADHAWRVRDDSRTCLAEPSSYLRRMWFDTIVHDPAQLRSLIDAVGSTQVVIGTDFPFDMGLDDPVGFLDSVAGLTPSEREQILGGNAEDLLGMDVGPPAGQGP
jgi:aminocarboxymuconate-semialdehyde decarboxylase